NPLPPSRLRAMLSGTGSIRVRPVVTSTYKMRPPYPCMRLDTSAKACQEIIILDTIHHMSNALASRLAPLAALDERGEAVTLGRHWSASPVVLAFVRHFG